MRFIVPLVAALVPLVMTPGALSYFDITPKVAILLFGVSCSVFFWSENVRNVTALLGTRAGRWLVSILALEWTSAVLATVFSIYPALSLNGGNWRCFGLVSETGLLLFVLLAAAWLTADSGNTRVLLRASTTSGALAALYGIAQYFGWDPLLPPLAYQAGEGRFTIVRPPGTVGHADYFGAWMVMVVFFGLALAQMETQSWRRVAAHAAAALAMVAVVLSGTRAAMLGVLVGAAVFLVLSRPRIRWIAVVAATVSIAGLALFFISPAGLKLQARLSWSRDDARGGARLPLWRDSLPMAAKRPLTGYGPEVFGTEFPRFESVELARAYPDFYLESPHNMFLDALLARGFLGLSAMLGLCMFGVWAGRTSAPLTAGFAGIVACQQFEVQIIATALCFYLLLAMLGVSPGTEAPSDRNHRWLLAPAVALALFLAVFAVRLLVADRALAVAQSRIGAGDPKGAAEAYAVTLRWQPAGSGSDLSYSRAMSRLQSRSAVFTTRLEARQQAMEAGIRSTRTAEDRQNAWYNLAILLAGQNDAAGTEHALRNSIAWAPNWFKPHWTLAQLLDLSGRHEEALREARLAVQLDGGRDAEVTQTLQLLQERSR